MENQVFISFSKSELSELINSAVNDALAKNTNREPSNDSEKLMSRQEAATFLKISLVTLHDWTKHSILKSYKIGGRIYYKQDEVISTATAVISKS